MASKKNEAYIEFKANTSEFQKGIKQMNAELKTASNELRLNATQLKNAGDNVDLLSERQRILEKELAASAEKIKLTEKSLAECEATLGKNSKEYESLNNAVIAAKNQQQAIQNELDQTKDKLAKITTENKQAATSFGQLGDKIEAQEKDLAALKKEYANVVLEQGKGSKEAKDLAKQIETLSGELKENKDKLNDAETAADKFDKTLDETSESADGFSGKLAAAGAAAVAFGAAIFEAGKASIEAFNEVDEGADNVIKATGATGEAAEELEAVYKNVASNIVGDFAEIGTALGEVNTRFGFTGEEAEEATTLFLKFSEVTGMDATTAVQDVSRAIESAGLKSGDYKTILDALTKAGQATGVSVDTLAGALTDNGAVMREMGYDTNETIAMLAQFEKAGVNSQTVTKGMQKALTNWAKDGKDAQAEFGNLVAGIKDGSVSAGEAYEVFGSKAGVELVDAIKSGRFEYEDMLAVIEGSKGSLETTFDATVDGGYELDLAMQNCKLALAEVGEVVGTMLVPVFQTISEKLLPAVSTGMEKLKAAGEWAAEHKGVVTAIAVAIGVLTTAITAYNIVQGIKTAMDAANVTTVWALVSAHIAQAAAAMAAIAPYVLIVAAIAAVIAIIVLCIKHWDKIKEKITEVAKKVKEKVTEIKNNITAKLNEAKQKAVEIFNNIKNGITQKINEAKNKVVEVFNNIKNSISSKLNEAKNKVTEIFNNIKNAISNKLNEAKQKISSIFDSIKSTMSNAVTNAKNAVVNGFQTLHNNVMSKVNSLKSSVSNTFNNIKNAILTPIENARDKVKGIVDKIVSFFRNMKISLPKIKLPHLTISGSFSLNPPSVPKIGVEWYAKGGFFNKPTILSGLGEAGPEYALPLNERSLAPLAVMLNKLTATGENGLGDILASRFDAVVDKLADRLEKLEMAVNIDGERVATATASYNDTNSGARAQLAERGLSLA